VAFSPVEVPLFLGIELDSLCLPFERIPSNSVPGSSNKFLIAPTVSSEEKKPAFCLCLRACVSWRGLNIQFFLALFQLDASRSPCYEGRMVYDSRVLSSIT
jgi:hypothetical protein